MAVRDWRPTVAFSAERGTPSGNRFAPLGNDPSTLPRFGTEIARTATQRRDHRLRKHGCCLRAYALRETLERRQKLITERRRRDEEQRRIALERDITHLERGIERW